MRAGGPVAAIQVCNSKAPAIATAMSAEHDMVVGRTSLRTRNPGNAPDEWERGMLEAFEQRKASGEDVSTLAHAEIIEQDGTRTFRFMKAIPTGEICLRCHGGNIAEAVSVELDQLYPEDNARGFAVGDIRGAFTVSRDL